MSAERVEAVLAANAPDLLLYFERRAGADATDLLAETMVTVWRRADQLPADDIGARMWVFGVARHVLQNGQRSERRRWKLADRLRTLRPVDLHAPGADDGIEVRDAIARLDPDSAELVRLVYWEGFAIAQAAEIIGIPASTARGRHQKAKQALSEALGAELDRQT